VRKTTTDVPEMPIYDLEIRT